MDSVLRPRDIQARIRSGESPETVAAAAQTTVEKIMPFAGPVLAERAFVAQQAQRASVRRRAGEGAPGQLGTAVAERLATYSVDPDDVEWDAWRRDDGRWTLVAAFDAAAGPERAEFVYDAAGRYVTATDDSSRRLVGERLPGATAPAEADEVPPADQLHLGDDAIELVTGRRPPAPVEVPDAAAVTELRPAAVRDDARLAPDDQGPAEPAPPAAESAEDRDEVTVDLTEPATAVRRARPVADSDWMATQASERPAAEPLPEAAADPAPGAAADAAPEALFEVPAADEADETPGEAPEPAPAAELTEAEKPARPARAKATKSAKGSKGRAAIPSWDEIMFGSSSGD